MATGTDESKVMAVGGAALTGWRGVAAGAVAKPIAKHSRYTEEQVKALLGLAILAYAFYRLTRPLIKAVRS
jgi:copper oxidase (laccase) domain-containing protein